MLIRYLRVLTCTLHSLPVKCERAALVAKDVGLIVFAVLLVGDLFHQQGVLCTTCNQAMSDMLRHFDSLQQLPPTQPTNSQSGSALTSTYRFNRLCVCVCNSCSEGCRINHSCSHVSRGAASISGSRCLTKTVQICCEMDRGRPIHVPAHVVEFKFDRCVVQQDKNK